MNVPLTTLEASVIVVIVVVYVADVGYGFVVVML